MTREEAIENAPICSGHEKYIRDSLQLMVWLENCRRISEYYPEVCKKI